MLERARINVALKQWDKAENDLKEYFRFREEKKHGDYNWFSNASLLQGYLRLQAKDEEGARAAWRRGLLKNVSKLSGHPEQAGLYIDPSAAINSMIMSALADDPSEEDNERNAAWLASLASRDTTVANFIQLASLPPTLFREMWRTPRGREWARRYALRDLTYAESARVPAWLTVSELIHQGITAGPLTEEQDDLVWKLVEDTYFAYLDRKVTEPQLLSMTLTWKGTPNIPGCSWQSVTQVLQPSVRGPLAYVMGLRYRVKLKKPAKETADFFRTALADAPPGSPLRRLAQEELDRPEAK